MSEIREEVPSLIELLRERVNIMSKTRSDLDKLLGRVDQEKVCAVPNPGHFYVQCVMLILSRTGL